MKNQNNNKLGISSTDQTLLQNLNAVKKKYIVIT